MIILSPIFNIVLQIVVGIAAKAICIMADPICAIIEVIAELFFLIVNGVLKLIPFFNLSVDRSAFFYCKPNDFRSNNLARSWGGGIFTLDPLGAWYSQLDSDASTRRRLEKTMSMIDRKTVDLNQTNTHVANLLQPIEPRRRRSLVEETFGTCNGENDYPCPSSRGKFICVKLEDRDKCPKVDMNREGVTYW